MAITSSEIETAAEGPASASGEMGSHTARPIDDLIKADQYTSGKDGIAGSGEGGGPVTGWALLRPAKFIPPGSV